MNDISIDSYKFAVLYNNGEVECNNNVSKHETEKSIIWIVNPTDENLNLSDIENLDNKKKFVNEISGAWACLIKNKQNNSFRVISSINNELPWYYTVNSPFLISNNIFLILNHLQKYDINYNAIASYLTFDHTFGGETFLNQIRKVYGGDIIYLSEQSIH